MKNIINLQGIQTLSKKEQSNIYAASRLFSFCTQRGRICCQDGECELGQCNTAGGSSFCIWY